jgi:hypothetical protein
MAPESGDDSRTTIDTSRHLTTVDTVQAPGRLFAARLLDGRPLPAGRRREFHLARPAPWRPRRAIALLWQGGDWLPA